MLATISFSTSSCSSSSTCFYFYFFPLNYILATINGSLVVLCRIFSHDDIKDISLMRVDFSCEENFKSKYMFEMQELEKRSYQHRITLPATTITPQPPSPRAQTFFLSALHYTCTTSLPPHGLVCALTWTILSMSARASGLMLQLPPLASREPAATPAEDAEEGEEEAEDERFLPPAYHPLL